MVTSRDEGPKLQNNLLDSWFIGGWLVGGSGILFRADLKMNIYLIGHSQKCSKYSMRRCSGTQNPPPKTTCRRDWSIRD